MLFRSLIGFDLGVALDRLRRSSLVGGYLGVLKVGGCVSCREVGGCVSEELELCPVHYFLHLRFPFTSLSYASNMM